MKNIPLASIKPGDAISICGSEPKTVAQVLPDTRPLGNKDLAMARSIAHIHFTDGSTKMLTEQTLVPGHYEREALPGAVLGPEITVTKVASK